jgi:hypothetical protein
VALLVLAVGAAAAATYQWRLAAKELNLAESRRLRREIDGAQTVAMTANPSSASVLLRASGSTGGANDGSTGGANDGYTSLVASTQNAGAAAAARRQMQGKVLEHNQSHASAGGGRTELDAATTYAVPVSAETPEMDLDNYVLDTTSL